MAQTGKAISSEGAAEVRAPVESMDIITRTPNASGPESKFEKVVILPNADDKDPANHAWADAHTDRNPLARAGPPYAHPDPHACRAATNQSTRAGAVQRRLIRLWHPG